ncbi:MULTISPECIES: hypothetical protein [Acinetobacter]|uniref:hypothetical protein n=1 Tax=Acinetobacter TaxID=469 RepID=UPI0021C87A37|nr:MULTISPECIES: hypothetical protein [Acinetobacter]MCT9980272.1 hypothetical protein [Acinetobacter sp. I-MWF]MCU4493438.1 hypothetical protein [Acinetobacter guillouiae]
MVNPTGTANTNQKPGSTQNIKVDRKNRIIVWGGAYSTSDINTFKATANNLQRMYKARDGSKYNIFIREIKIYQDLIDLINRQPENSIKSLDIFTHGGQNHLWMVSVRESDTDNDRIKWSIYDLKWIRGLFKSANFGVSDLKKINFKGFMNDAKIEIQGCNTAEDPHDSNNLSAAFSRYLYNAGKIKSYVIGHTTQSNPRINGSSTKISEQSYMWMRRVVYRNGHLILDTKDKGFLDSKIK